ncbi:MAG: trypsin-like peptidase domain-containing protein [Aulosira sp. DedQUE10]|nr:trypsin-like peptidase domain-containing protein [Aulosira sp. DedQUE10]
MRRHLATLLIFPTLIPSHMAFAQNSQPSYNQRLGIYSKPSVVRILTSCEGTFNYNLPNEKNQRSLKLDETFLGSGYFINSDGYILTTANVAKFAEDRKACEKYLTDKLFKKLDDDYNLTVAEKTQVKDSIKVKKIKNVEQIKNEGNVVLPKKSTEDFIFQFKVKELGTTQDFSSDVAIIKIALTNAPVLELADSDAVNIQDEVLVIGYPTAADNTDALKDESILEASVTEGKVSSPNKRLQDNSPVLQIGVQVANGSAGSPVLNSQGKVIGIITLGGKKLGEKEQEQGAFVPIAIPSRTIKEFIIQSGLTNKQGVVDRRYQQGLELFWKRDYRGAKTQFEAVRVLFPQHSEVDRLIGDSEQKIADTWDTTDYTPWLVAIGGFIAGTIAVLLFVNLRKRNSSSATEFPGGLALANVTEESGIEQEAENPPMRVLAESVSNIYRSQTLMSMPTAYIELKNSQGVVRKLNLLEEHYQIGRDPNWSNIDLSEPEWNIISWHHAILKKERDNYRIYDGDGTRLSTNRILINNKPIDPQAGHLLKDGDQFKIGLDPENQVILTYFNPVSK